jgi:purine-nucleoside phosphorylase
MIAGQRFTDELQDSARFLAQKTKLRPKLGFVLGSGLSGFAKEVDIDVEIPFAQIPHFAVSSVEGHPGKLVIGSLRGVPVAVMLGRLHAYEGLTFQQVVFPVRTLAVFGIKTLVLTNAAGGLSPKMKPGDFMVIKDHLNCTGDNPLRGPNLPLGPRFVDMTEPYDKKLRQALRAALTSAKARTHEGVYVGVLGPTYETAAEIKFYGKMGGGAVGMSTVREAIAARHAGLKLAGLSCITNLGTGLSKMKLTHEDVKEVAAQVESKFARALVAFTEKIKNDL